MQLKSIHQLADGLNLDDQQPSPPRVISEYRRRGTAWSHHPLGKLFPYPPTRVPYFKKFDNLQDLKIPRHRFGGESCHELTDKEIRRSYWKQIEALVTFNENWKGDVGFENWLTLYKETREKHKLWVRVNRFRRKVAIFATRKAGFNVNIPPEMI